MNKKNSSPAKRLSKPAPTRLAEKSLTIGKQAKLASLLIDNADGSSSEPGTKQLKGAARQIQKLLAEAPNNMHLTAIEIQKLAAVSGFSISISGVYRALERLKDQGVIQSVRAGQRSRAEAFESTQNRGAHAHLICFVCGMTLEAESIFSELGARIAERYGYDFSKSELLLKGICKDCRSS